MLGAIHCLKQLTAGAVVKRESRDKFSNAPMLLRGFSIPKDITNLWLSPVHEYAALYWAHHLLESGDYWKMYPLKALVDEFMLGKQQDTPCAFQRWATDIRLEHWYRHYASFNWTSQCSRRNFEASCEPVDPIFAASIWNLRDILEMRVCAEPKSLSITSAGFQGARLKAFEFACLHGNLEAAQYLLSKVADSDRSTESLRTSLVGAILCKNVDLVRLLLEHGADPNPRPDPHLSIHDLENDGHRSNPLITGHAPADISLAHYESLRYANPLIEAVKTPCTALVQLLMDFGADPRADPDPDGIMNAKSNKWERRPLHWAIGGGHADVTRCLLGGDACSTDFNKFTLLKASQLIEAVLHKDQSGLTQVLEEWPELSRNSDQAELAKYCGAWSKYRHGKRLSVLNLYLDIALYNAAGNADDTSARLLLDCGADANAKVIGYLKPKYPLTIAVLGHDHLGLVSPASRKFIVEVLLNAGANPNVDLPTGRTLLSATAIMKHGEELVELLFSAGAIVDSYSNYWSKTPLYAAIRDGNIQTARCLLGHGADPNRICRPLGVDGDPETGLDIAREYNGPQEIIELLLEHGAVSGRKRDVKDSTTLEPGSPTQPLQGRRILPLRRRRKVEGHLKSP